MTVARDIWVEDYRHCLAVSSISQTKIDLALDDQIEALEESSSTLTVIVVVVVEARAVGGGSSLLLFIGRCRLHQFFIVSRRKIAFWHQRKQIW